MFLTRPLVLLSALLVVFPAVARDTQPPKTFSQAKKIAWSVYAERQTTFYCGCSYQGKRVDLASCGYRPRKNAERAGRLEWEHVVPAWVIGHQRQCWQQGGRRHCTRSDPLFRAAEADLHNLVPSIGELNGDRSHHALGMLGEKPYQYGQCAMLVNFKQKTAMPPVGARGAAARIYLYMANRYQLRLSKLDRRTYEAWNRQYPVNDWERWRNQKTACAMGWGNPYIGPTDLAHCTDTRQSSKPTGNRG